MKSLAILGATGLVGRMMVQMLEERKFPVVNLKLLSSELSRGKEVAFHGEAIKVQTIDDNAFKGVDIALFAVDAPISKEIAPKASARCVVIDNSSAFRMEPGVPLVVPEVNPGAAFEHKGIIANPNCSTIQLVVVLYPLHKVAKLKRVIVSTYQSVSGMGKEAIEELEAQLSELKEGEKVSSLACKVFPAPIACNVIPQIGEFSDSHYTAEELKMINETRKILSLPQLMITATTVRVPVFYGHSESVTVEFEQKLTVSDAIDILEKAPGVRVAKENNRYPLPIDIAGSDDVWVGRLRKDTSSDNGLNLWIVADNLRKGAATNAVQIAELLL